MDVMEPILSAAKTSGGADLVKDTDINGFMVDVIEASRKVPVIVDFWAPWCGPCKTLGPALEKAVKQANGAVRMVKINIDENPEIAQQMRIQSIPAVYAFKNGRPVDGFVGAVPDSQIKQFIQRLAPAPPRQPSPVEQALGQAKAALAANDGGTASALFAQILAHEPDNVAAATGLARCYVMAGDTEQAKEIIDAPAERGRQRRGGAAGARGARPRAARRRGVGPDGRAAGQGRARPGRPPGAHRSCRSAVRQRPAGAGDRPAARDRSSATASGTTRRRASSS